MRARPLVRRLSSLGRVFVALVLLGALWFGTVKAVNDATDHGQTGRLQDRLQLAHVLSRPMRDWVDAASRETRELGVAVGGARGQAARSMIDDYLGGGRTFARAAVVVDDRMSLLAASADRAPFVGRPLTPCVVNGVEDTAVRDLARARAGVPSGVVALPGTCAASVVVAVPVGSATLLVFGSLDDLRSRLAHIASEAAPLRVSVVDGRGTRLASSAPDPAPAPEEVRRLVGRGDRSRTGRYFSGDGDVVGAFQPAGAAWGLLVEQSTDAFDVAPGNRPALKVAALLTAAFAAVFVLVAWFDVRRRRAASRADDDRNAFLAIVGHELRTPLTVIKGYTDTLAQRWDALDDSSRQMLVENMAPQAQRQARVIEHLLTAAALQAGTGRALALQPVEVGPVIERAVAEAKGSAPLHHFDVAIPSDLPLALADGEALGQVLTELLDNAVRFSPSGGAVRVRAGVVRGGVEMVVEDDGVGLPSDPKRLFRPLTQAEDVDRRVHAEGGVGVGLFIVRALLERMGGTARAENREEGGARVTVRLPVAPATRRRQLVRTRP